jgi:Xaa-Pro dipeptidase
LTIHHKKGHGTMNIDYSARQRKLIGITGVDAVALVPGANLTYFTGLDFELSKRPTVALFSDDGLAFIVPELEVPRIAQRPDLEPHLFVWSDKDGFAGAFAEAVKKLKLTDSPLGVDGLTMRVFERDAFESAGAKTIKNVGKNLLSIRAIKTESEVELMRQACKMSESALHRLMAVVKAGMTEREIAEMLSRYLIEAGCDSLSFDTHVQTGENSALPHGTVSSRVLGENDYLLIDYGGRFNNYPADITRTFCLGTPTDKMREIYDVVLEANRAALAVAKAGVPCSVLDDAARAVITNAGYGEYFTHRTGHGLGLEIHELPQIAGGVEDVLEVGMVFTIEPGIYISGLGGVRIEDNIHITENGAESLTHFPRRLSYENKG